MENKRVIIIGGGLAGLCSGIYLQMNGYRTTIMEAHHLPGGLCTSWHRKGYTFDGCLHWLLGSAAGSPMHGVWKELIDLESFTFVDHDHVLDLEVGVPDARGDTFFHFYADIDKQERYLLEAAPEDAKFIGKWMSAARSFAGADFPAVPVPAELKTWGDKLSTLKVLPLVPALLRFGTKNTRELAERARGRFMKAVLGGLYGDHDAPLLVQVFQQAWYSSRVCGYPIGGSLPFARSFEARYLELGGEVRYRARVSKIVVESGAAVGVELEDGGIERADVVVSAADGWWTLHEGLGGRYMTPTLEKLYSGELMPTFPSLVYVSLGIRGKPGLPCHLTRYLLEEPWILPDGSVVKEVPIHAYDYDPTLAPEGCTAVTVMLESRALEFWRDLRERDRAAYDEAKRAVGDGVVDLLERRVGGVRELVEVVDVATPATFHRYTGNWQGSYEGWLPTGNVLALPKIEKELPGLSGFHMVGQWVEPGGGLPPCALHGRQLAQVLCARDGRPFVIVPPASAD